MNVQKDQIQALIAEIDEVLNLPSLRLPWVVFGETVTRSRQVLERVRNYLITLEQEADDSVAILPTDPSGSGSGSLREPLWQAIRREMVYLRTHLTQPLQDEVDHLRQEQRSLLQEIQQLEARKAQILVSIQPQAYQQQLSREFLQELMTRLQDTLIQNVTETLSHIETRFLDSILLPEANSNPGLVLPEEQHKIGVSGSSLSTRLTPAQRLEQMRQLQAQSDHLLMTLDSSLSVIFEALQRNLQTYSDSLSQSIERMHSLGQQGEVMFTSWVNQLAQHVGEETSSYLQSSLQFSASEEAENAPPMVDQVSELESLPMEEVLSPLPTVDQAPAGRVFPEPEPENLQREELLPYAGVEFPKQTDRGARLREQAETQEIETEELNFDELLPPMAEESDSALEVENDSPLIEEELALPLDVEENLSETDEESAFSGLFNEAETQTETELSDRNSESAFSGLFNEADTQTETQLSDRNEESDFSGLFEAETQTETQLSDRNEPSSELELLFETVPKEIPRINSSEAQQPDIDLFNEEEEETVLEINQIKEEFVLTPDMESIKIELTPEEEEETSDTEDLFTQESISESHRDRQTGQWEEVALEPDLFPEDTNISSLSPDPALQQMAAPQTVERHPFEETLADFSDIFEELNLEQVSSDPNAGIVSARTQQELTQSIPSVPQPSQPRQERFEEDYIPASQEENLLPHEEELDSDQMDTHLMIDRNTIEQLEADLFNLEQPEPSFSSNRANPKGATKPEQSVSTAVAPTRTQPIETKSVTSRPEEVITFDDLFKELGMGSHSTHPVSLTRNQSQEQALEVKTYSDLTLDDVFESFDLAMEDPIDLEAETKQPLSLETLGEEIWNSPTDPARATKKRMKS